MRIYILFTLVIFLLPDQSLAQVILSAKFTKSFKGTVYLHSFYGTKTNLIDSCEIKKRKIKFYKKGQPTGFYRIKVKNDYYDCILNSEEETTIEFNGEKLNENVVVSKGKNQVLYEKLRKIKSSSRKEYDEIKNDKNLTQELKNSKTKAVKEKEDSLVQKILLECPDCFFNATVKTILPHKINPEKLLQYEGDTITYLTNHFFDDIDFSNEALVRSTVLPNVYMKYFSKYVEYDENGFKKAIDLILGKSSKNSTVYNLSLEYLMELFQTNGPEIIFEYIYQNYYLKESCDNLGISEKTKEKINQYKALSPGQKAPDIIDCITHTGEKIKEIPFHRKKPTMLFFWSTHCQFCDAFIKELSKINTEKTELIGINIDENSDEWKQFSTSVKLNFKNYHAEGSWDSPLARKYLINKTPGIFIINEFGIIKERNITVSDAINFLLN